MPPKTGKFTLFSRIHSVKIVGIRLLIPRFPPFWMGGKQECEKVINASKHFSWNWQLGSDKNFGGWKKKIFGLVNFMFLFLGDFHVDKMN